MCWLLIWAAQRQKQFLRATGELTVSNHSEVAHVHRFKRGSGLPLMVPMIEMIEIGAGGGSIAHLNRLGLPGWVRKARAPTRVRRLMRGAAPSRL